MLCSNRTPGNLKTLFRHYSCITWQCETNSKLELSDDHGMKIGKRIWIILHKNVVSHQDQSRFLLILTNDFGLNELRFHGWKTELLLCRCGEYSNPAHFVFFCKTNRKKKLYWHIVSEENRQIFDSVKEFQNG